MKKFTFMYLFFLLGSLSAFSQNDSCISNVRLGISFPPIMDANQRTFSQGHMDSLSVNLFRFGENWANREAVQGTYNWGPLDSRINWAQNNGYEMLMTIQSQGPSWACNANQQNANSCVFSNPSQFETYVDTLLKRYPNQIAKIQFGNEWHSDFWFIGNAQDFITASNIVYNSIQLYSPQTEFVLGGFASGTMTSFAACTGKISSFYDDNGVLWNQSDINAFCSSPTALKGVAMSDSIMSMGQHDWVDMHLYDDVEIWPLKYEVMDSMANGKPILVSEMGGPHLTNEPYSDQYQAERLYQYIKMVDSLQIPEAYFFKLVDGGTAAAWHQKSGLIDETTLDRKPAYFTFQKMNNICLPNSIEPEQNSTSILIYPNPTQDNVYLKSNNWGTAALEVYDMQGKLILSQTLIKEEETLKLEGMKKGIYLLIIKTNGTIFNRKIIKQ